jgi:cobalt-precorrin-6B (C15)-methyltransferase
MSYHPGIDDSEFIRGDIPMTKREIRMMIMNQARIEAEDVVIDVGAGTGSLSVEASLQATRGKVYAIEREAEGASLIEANARKFKASNISVIHGGAPESLNGLPSANVIFIGGSGGKLKDILAVCDRLLKPAGRLVITAITLETLYSSLQFMQDRSAYDVNAFGMQVTRIKKVHTSNMLQALNPIYIITCTKKG